MTFLDLILVIFLVFATGFLCGLNLERGVAKAEGRNE